MSGGAQCCVWVTVFLVCYTHPSRSYSAFSSLSTFNHSGLHASVPSAGNSPGFAVYIRCLLAADGTCGMNICLLMVSWCLFCCGVNLMGVGWRLELSQALLKETFQVNSLSLSWITKVSVNENHFRDFFHKLYLK
jgi:hypothetical protein